MPQVEQVHHKSNKPVIVGVAALVAVMLVVVAVVWLVQRPKQPPKPDTATVQKEALAKSFKKDYDGAIAALTAQLKNTKNDDEKLNLYLAIGNNYMQKPDAKRALGAFHEAAKIRGSYGSYEGVARLAEQTGDKALALEYYQKTRALIKEGKEPLHEDDLSVIEAAIKRLGGSL